MTPTARTLKHMRDNGWRCEVVEKWNPHTRTRHDLYGFIDILCIRPGQTLAIQVTTSNNMAAREHKIREQRAEQLADVIAAGWQVQIHGWRKNSRNRWVHRTKDILP